MKPESWRRVEKLFNAALEQKPERRADFLAEACAGDEGLRSEVESLLQQGDQPDGFIDTPAMKMVARDMASNSVSPTLSLSMIGKTLSHYKIVGQLGAGGMGVVYRARDTKLGRDVAVKVLPGEFARDPDRIARFQREAKILASLNHSNIAAIFDLQESDGGQFLVQELIEGETLADRLKHGPIPVEESLGLAQQITEALEAAHEKGVIHRDLKPANIKITPEGKAKVLDFGLARALGNAVRDGDSSRLSETGETITEPGVVLGTATYMSPEQVKGKSVDERTDIWAFGCVLYEMLTGKSPFAGEDFSQTLANVLEREPGYSLLPRNINPRIRKILERCLEKDPKRRWHHAADVRLDIQGILADGGGGLAKEGLILPSRWQSQTVIALAASAAALGMLVAGLAVWKFGPVFRHESQPAIQFVYELPEDQYFTNTDRRLVDVSSDGTKMVYVANRRLYLKYFRELTAKPVPGTEKVPFTPFFSYDGKWIAYWSQNDRELKKISVNGGVPVTLCSTGPPFGASWGKDDIILLGQTSGILRVAGSGGTPEIIVKTGQGERVHGPRMLPGGQWVLFTITSISGSNRWDKAQIVAQSLKSDERRVLVSGGSDARYVPTGHLVYASGSELFAVPFSVDDLEVSGAAIPIVQGVQRTIIPGINTGTAHYSFSEGGMLAYVSAGTANSKRNLVWVDRDGNEAPLEVSPGHYSDPRISPDGAKLALTNVVSGNSDIWIWDLVRKKMSRLTFEESSELLPTWTLDNKQIIFSSFYEGTSGLFRKKTDGTGKSEFLFSDAGKTMYSSSLSNDGKTISIVEYGPEGFEIATGLMEGDHALKPLFGDPHNEFHARISPNGKWIAYTSDESGQLEVYVNTFPDVKKGKWQVSTSGGESPVWSQDSRELFYRGGSAVMAVSITTDPVFKAQIPKMLFYNRYFAESGTQWDVSPDGRKFLMIKESDSARKIIVTTNWFEELKEKVPAH